MVQVGSTPKPINLQGERQNYFFQASILNTDYVLFGFDKSLFQSMTTAFQATMETPGYAVLFPGDYVVLKQFSGTVWVMSNNTENQTVLVMPIKVAIEDFIFDLKRARALYDSVAGAANGAITAVANLYNMRQMSILVVITGTAGGSLSATIRVSIDRNTWVSVDTIAIPTGLNAILPIVYNENHLASTVAVNPADFPFVSIAIPSLGSGVSATIIWSARP